MITERKIPIIVRFSCLALIFVALPLAADAQTVSGIKVPSGFEVTKVAGDELATNIYCMAVSPNGETFVSGPGYIKVLVDNNDDGVFDSVRQYSNRPKSGAQGMCFDGNDLLCTGDGGLWRFADADHDGVADGDPVKIFSIKTGGEHDAHAIRKGPDGWWYLLAGNGTPILPEYYAGASSPVTEPRGGFLMRISPDWATKEIFCHGFRNAYDFDFNSMGEVFIYDSDGERDISLPWYRPTRLYKMRSGDDAGWVAAGWKRPSFYFDMPIEIGALGRGSPTGVVCGSSQSFPSSYQDAIFVADWTFGRVVAFGCDPNSGGYDRGTDFAIADGQFGFAVTDLDFAQDGSLLISAGGRGTQGAVYRVRFTGQPDDDVVPNGRPNFVAQTKSKRLSAEVLIEAMSDPSKTIQDAAIEALIGRKDILQKEPVPGALLNKRLVDGLQSLLISAEPKTLALLMRVVEDLDPKTLESIDQSRLPVASQLMLDAISPSGPARSSNETCKKIVDALATGQSDPKLLARIGQLALGGCGDESSDQMFMGYTARTPADISTQDKREIADKLAGALALAKGSSKSADVDEHDLQEIGRFAAMLGCGSPDLQAAMAGLLSREDSTAQQDIHWLNCICQIIDDRENQLADKLASNVASALVGISAKIKRDGQNVDRNFHPRMKSLAQRICRRAGTEFALMVAIRLTGGDDQLFLFEALPGIARDSAVPRFVASVESDPADVTAGQLNVIASHSGGVYLPLVRKFADRTELQDVVIASLVRSPAPEDRRLFVRGLKSSNLKTVRNAAIGLRRLSDRPRAEEIVAAYAALRRLVGDKRSVSVRDQLVLFMQNETDQEFGYVPGRGGLAQEDAVIRWGEFIQISYPQEFAAEFDKKETRQLAQRLVAINWNAGDQERGKKIYRSLQCAQCHDSGSRLGPRLEGIVNRFSREDVFRAIMLPNEQVPDRYRAIVIETIDGQFFRGSMVYESVDGITLQETDGNTVRINTSDIESRAVSKKSLMPEGLLKEATDQDWADLFAFLSQSKK